MWERLCLALWIVDIWHLYGFIRERDIFLFSWSARCIGGMNLFWIQRMYVSDLLGNRDGSMGILSGTCMLDHVSVVLLLSYSDRRYSWTLYTFESVQLDEDLAEKARE